MLCSICNKNTAVIFINKQMPDNSIATEGFCYECAKKKGITPLDSLAKQANISEEDIKNMTEQLENMFKDMSGNMDMDFNFNIDSVNDSDEADGGLDDSDSPNAIPLGAILAVCLEKGQTLILQILHLVQKRKK